MEIPYSKFKLINNKDIIENNYSCIICHLDGNDLKENSNMIETKFYKIECNSCYYKYLIFDEKCLKDFYNNYVIREMNKCLICKNYTLDIFDKNLKHKLIAEKNLQNINNIFYYKTFLFFIKLLFDLLGTCLYNLYDLQYKKNIFEYYLELNYVIDLIIYEITIIYPLYIPYLYDIILFKNMLDIIPYFILYRSIFLIKDMEFHILIYFLDLFYFYNIFKIIFTN